MTQEEDRQKIFEYREEVRAQYNYAQKTGSDPELEKANKMYGKLMYMGNQYRDKYKEPIEVFL